MLFANVFWGNEYVDHLYISCLRLSRRSNIAATTVAGHPVVDDLRKISIMFRGRGPSI